MKKQKTPKQEVEELMNDLLPLAKQMLGEDGEFYPYGGYMTPDGRITHVGAKIEGTERPKSAPLIELLREEFKKIADENRCKATAIISDVKITPPDSKGKSDAIQICLDHKNGYSAEVFFPYHFNKDEITYDNIFAQRGVGLIFGND